MANSMYQIYSKSGCIFCDAAMELLDSKNLEYKEIKIDGPDNTDALQFVKEQGSLQFLKYMITLEIT